ncbi:2941_t:CDS:2, partial [Dentiscutata erythropus]
EERIIPISMETKDYNVKEHNESNDRETNIEILPETKDYSIDNIENDGHGQQQPDEFYELDKQYEIITAFFDDDGNVSVSNGLDESGFQQISNKSTHHNSIHNLSTFKEIQNMLKEIVEKEEIDRITPNTAKFEDGN